MVHLFHDEYCWLTDKEEVLDTMPTPDVFIHWSSLLSGIF